MGGGGRIIEGGRVAEWNREYIARDLLASVLEFFFYILRLINRVLFLNIFFLYLHYNHLFILLQRNIT